MRGVVGTCASRMFTVWYGWGANCTTHMGRHSSHSDTGRSSAEVQCRKARPQIRAHAILATASAQMDWPEQRSIRLPIVLTLRATSAIHSRQGKRYVHSVIGGHWRYSAHTLSGHLCLCYAGRPDNHPRISKGSVREGRRLRVKGLFRHTSFTEPSSDNPNGHTETSSRSECNDNVSKNRRDGPAISRRNHVIASVPAPHILRCTNASSNINRCT